MVALLVFAIDFYYYNFFLFFFLYAIIYNSQSKQLFQNYKSRHRSITHTHSAAHTITSLFTTSHLDTR